ncbi:hypothetical protein GCM10008997_15800 [Halomonas salifodinae]
METSCALCQSAAVLSREDVGCLVRVIGTLGGFLRGTQLADIALPNEESPHRATTLLDYITTLSAQGIAGATAHWRNIKAFERDVKQQFMGHAYLCLRCGATYDTEPEGVQASERPSRSQS